MCSYFSFRVLVCFTTLSNSVNTASRVGRINDEVETTLNEAVMSHPRNMLVFNEGSKRNDENLQPQYRATVENTKRVSPAHEPRWLQLNWPAPCHCVSL